MSTPSLPPPLTGVVCAMAQAAHLASWIRDRHQGMLVVRGGARPVTLADLAVQALIAHALEQAFPGDALVAEEDASLLRQDSAAADALVHILHPLVPDATADRIASLLARGTANPRARFWTLDPIDGTAAFIRGDLYAVALALIENGSVTTALLAWPGEPGFASWPDMLPEHHFFAGSVLYAAREQGAWNSPRAAPDFSPIAVSGRADLEEAICVRSSEPSHVDLARSEALARQLGLRREPCLADGQTKHVLLATGQVDIMVRIPPSLTYRDAVWDQAAGTLVIEEAGGCVTDLMGEALDFSAGRYLSHNIGLVATNGILHEDVLDALAAPVTPARHPASTKV